MKLPPAEQLLRYIAQSNSIENINREPTPEEVEAHMRLLSLPSIGTQDMEIFVAAVQPGARLRLAAGDMVTVGRHVAPAPGMKIMYGLQNILEAISDEDSSFTPYSVHCSYLTLHPFTDGNGRSARALYAWHSMKIGYEGFWGLGFLRQFYYDALGAADGRR